MLIPSFIRVFVFGSAVLALPTAVKADVLGCRGSVDSSKGAIAQFYAYKSKEDIAEDSNSGPEGPGISKSGSVEDILDPLSFEFKYDSDNGDLFANIFGYQTTYKTTKVILSGFFLAEKTGKHTFNFEGSTNIAVRMGSSTERCSGEFRKDIVDDFAIDTRENQEGYTTNKVQVNLQSGFMYPMEITVRLGLFETKFVSSWEDPDGLTNILSGARLVQIGTKPEKLETNPGYTGGYFGCSDFTETSRGVNVDFISYPERVHGGNGKDVSEDFAGYKQTDSKLNVLETFGFSYSKMEGQVIYGHKVSPKTSNLVISGYFLAGESGNYTFSFGGNSKFSVQFGSHGTCSRDVQQDVTGIASVDTLKEEHGSGTEFSADLKAGVAYPVRIFVLLENDMAFSPELVTPSGVERLLTGDMFVQIGTKPEKPVEPVEPVDPSSSQESKSSQTSQTSQSSGSKSSSVSISDYNSTSAATSANESTSDCDTAPVGTATKTTLVSESSYLSSTEWSTPSSTGSELAVNTSHSTDFHSDRASISGSMSAATDSVSASNSNGGSVTGLSSIWQNNSIFSSSTTTRLTSLSGSSFSNSETNSFTGNVSKSKSGSVGCSSDYTMNETKTRGVTRTITCTENECASVITPDCSNKCGSGKVTTVVTAFVSCSGSVTSTVTTTIVFTAKKLGAGFDYASGSISETQSAMMSLSGSEAGSQSGPKFVPGSSQSGMDTVPGSSQSGMDTVPGFSQSGMDTVPGSSQSGMDTVPGFSQSGMDTVPGSSQTGMKPFPDSAQTGMTTISSSAMGSASSMPLHISVYEGGASKNSKITVLASVLIFAMLI